MIDGSSLLTTIIVLVEDWYQMRKKIDGLCVHVAPKMTNYTLRIFLYQRFGIDVLTFAVLNSHKVFCELE